MLEEVGEGEMSGASGIAGKQEDAPAPARPSASVVGGSFVEQYFKTLANRPDLVHRFYNAESVFSRVENGAEMSLDSTSVGQVNIHSTIRSLEYQDCKVLVDSVDCQDSLDGSVLVLITGLLSNKSQTPRRFVQTVLLARQERGFYVRNDVLRYLDAPEQSEEATPTTEPAPISAASSADDETAAIGSESVEVSREETEQEVEEEAGEDEPSADDNTISDIVEAGDEIVERPPEQVVEPADAVAEQAPAVAPAKPASWAALFTSVAPLPTPAASAASVVAPPVKSEPEPSAEAVAATAATTNVSLSEAETVSTSQLFVSNIPESATAADLRASFEKFGAVSRVDLRDKRNFAFVAFASADGLTNALQSGSAVLNGVELSFEPRRARKGTAGERGQRGRGRFRGGQRFEHRGRGRGAQRRGAGAPAAAAARDSAAKKQ